MSADLWRPNGDPLEREPPEYDTSPECPCCGGETRWEDCDGMCDGGYHDMHEMSPMEYEPGETEKCWMCEGHGGWWFCVNSFVFCHAEGLERGTAYAARWRWS